MVLNVTEKLWEFLKHPSKENQDKLSNDEKQAISWIWLANEKNKRDGNHNFGLCEKCGESHPS